MTPDMIADATFRTIVDRSADGILVADCETKQFRYANVAASRLLGYSAHELLSMSIRDIHPKDALEHVFRDFDALARGEKTSSADIPCLRKNGTIVYADITVGVVTIDGRALAVGSFRDVTERKVKSEELIRLRKAVEASGEAIFTTDGEGLITFVNPAFTNLYGYSAAEVVGKTTPRVLKSGTLAEADYKSFWGAIMAKQEVKGELVNKTKDGRLLDIENTANSIVDESGQLVGFLAIQRDITERKRLRASLAQSDRLSSMGMLAAGVAHEINNPLSYVLSNLDGLLEDAPKAIAALRQAYSAVCARIGSDAANELFNVVPDSFTPALLDDFLARLRDAQSGTMRIKNIVRGLGTFSRVESTQLAPTDVTLAIEHAISIAYNEIKYRARLVKNLGKVPMVLGTDGRLAQVFLNLLINAAHAIDEGRDAHNEIRIRTWYDDDHVFTEVRDTGGGIAPENRGRIFEPFFTTKGAGVGTGLGLSICKTIVTGCGGDITFTSEMGQGTCFLVRLPRLPSHWATSREATTAPTHSRSKIRGRLLVVDDEDGIRAAIVRLLGREHEVVTVSSAKEAQTLLEIDGRYDLLLLDLMMPGMSGMELHQWLVRRMPPLAEQVVFLSGGAFTRAGVDYMAQVDNLRIEKPFDSTSLKRMVEELVRAARARAEPSNQTA